METTMEKWLYRASIIITVIGLAVSIYMTIFKLTDNESMCIGNGGCSIVNNSPYAVIYGIPVAAFGVGGYLAILLVLIFEKKAGQFFEKNATMLLDRWPGESSVFAVGLGIGHVNACAPIGRHGSSF